MSARPPENPTVWILDAYYLIFRAFRALPRLTAPDGTPVGAVRGYLQTLVRLLRRSRPSHVAAAADFALTSFRNDVYAAYKRGRTEPPPDLAPQFPLCAEVTRALGIPYLEVEKYEADDVIASLVRLLRGSGAQIRIVTADKDLGALVSEEVALVDPADGATRGPAEIEERFGVPPALIPDLLALAGDAVDGIPGVRGIGMATARTLLRRFGGIDRIPTDEPGWAGTGLRQVERVRRSLAAGRDALALSRDLVRLRDDLPLEITLEDLAWSGADRGGLPPLLERLGLGRMIGRVPRWQP